MKFRLALVWVTALGAGCSSGPRGDTATAGGASRVLVTADWNDVDAAVDLAVGKVEMAALGDPKEPSADQRVFELVTINDEPGRLTVRRVRVDRGIDRGEGGSEPLELTATVGAFGSPGRERALLEAVSARLKDLAGVDFAPIR